MAPAEFLRGIERWSRHGLVEPVRAVTSMAAYKLTTLGAVIVGSLLSIAFEHIDVRQAEVTRGSIPLDAANSGAHWQAV